jgi:hypothetical protein
MEKKDNAHWNGNDPQNSSKPNYNRRAERILSI